MKTTIMVMDVFVRFRLVAIAQSDQQTQAWEMQVMCIQQVADILISLGFLDSKAAALLAEASTTITPQLGITTVPFSDFATLTELVFQRRSVQLADSGNLLARICKKLRTECKDPLSGLCIAPRTHI
jgi:hypothetical protein